MGFDRTTERYLGNHDVLAETDTFEWDSLEKLQKMHNTDLTKIHIHIEEEVEENFYKKSNSNVLDVLLSHYKASYTDGIIISLDPTRELYKFISNNFTLRFGNIYPDILIGDRLYISECPAKAYQVADDCYIVLSIVYGSGAEPAVYSHVYILYNKVKSDKIKVASRAKEILTLLIKQFTEWKVKERQKFFKNQTDVKKRLILPKDFKDELFRDLDVFLGSYKEYKKLNLTWKRGFLFHGPPGNGKTLTIRTLASYYGLEMQDLLDYIDRGRLRMPTVEETFSTDQAYGPINLSEITESTSYFPKLYFLEDIDKVIGGNDEDIPVLPAASLLNALDGAMKLQDGSIIIATTNNIKKIVDALVARPGRFDRVFEFGNPSYKQVTDFFKFYNVVIQPNSEEDYIKKELAKLTMAFVEDFVKTALSTTKTTTIEIDYAKKLLKQFNEHLKVTKDKKGDLGFNK
jgi:DNA polymerase III delta prime subunit